MTISINKGKTAIPTLDSYRNMLGNFYHNHENQRLYSLQNPSHQTPLWICCSGEYRSGWEGIHVLHFFFLMQVLYRVVVVGLLLTFELLTCVYSQGMLYSQGMMYSQGMSLQINLNLCINHWDSQTLPHKTCVHERRLIKARLPMICMSNRSILPCNWHKGFLFRGSFVYKPVWYPSLELMLFFQWLLSWLLHKWRRRLSWAQKIPPSCVSVITNQELMQIPS